MKKILLFLASSLMLFASCAKEDSKVEPSPVDPTKPEGELIYSVTVSLGDSTKATLGEPVNNERKVTWNTGDKICVNGSVSDALDEEFDGEETATFTFSTPISESATYIACYPASVYKDATHVTLPATQGDAAGENIAKAFPMVGKADAEGLHTISLKQLCGFIRVKVQGNGQLSFVEFRGNGDEQVSGEFSIAFNDDVPTLTAGGIKNCSDRKVRVNCSATLSGTDQYCIIAVPAGEYSNGSDLRFVTKTNKYFSANSTSAKTITRASVKNISTVDIGTPSKDYVKISSASDWNNFATNFNAEAYSANPIVSIEKDIDFNGVTPILVGSYGVTDAKYCDAFIDGNGFSFKNIVSGTNPLIAAIDGEGELKNLTIDSSCSFAPNFNNSRSNHFGPFCEYVKGTIENCVNNASITVNPSSKIEFSVNNYVGGIAGRVQIGTIKNCTNDGAITLGTNYSVVVPSSTSTIKRALIVGGIVGWMSNASGSLDNCTNNGTLSIESTAEPIYIGGIAGISDGSISSCTNASALSVSTTRASDDRCKNIHFGGVVGDQTTNGNLSNCSNTANLTTSSNVKLQGIGGIAGTFEGGSISGNTNSGNIVSNAGVRQLFAGGIIGTLKAAGTHTFTGTPATGKISVSSPESGPSSYLYLGGLVGRVALDSGEKAIIKGDNLSSVCDINLEVASPLQLAEAGFGGILGSVGLDSSTGNTPVEIDYCNVSGNGVKVTMAESVTFTPKALGMGGILGYSKIGATIKNCSVAAAVSYLGAMSKSNNSIVDCGGIAGRILGANSEISNCSVTTTTNGVYNNHYNNNAVTATTGNGTGGIIGSFGHVSDNSSTLTITNCTSSAEVYAYRCCGGGIAGFLDNATVKGCNVTGKIANANYAGGLVGYASNCTFGSAKSADACTFNCTSGIVSTAAGSCKNYAGGLAGQTVDCSFTNCGSYFGTTPGINAAGTINNGNAPGSLIGYSDANTAVASCKAGGKMQSANYGMPGASGTTSATLDETTVLTYAVGNKAFTPTSGNVTLWDGK